MNWIVLLLNIIGILVGIAFGRACRNSLPGNRPGGLILLVLLCGSFWLWGVALGYMHQPDFSVVNSYSRTLKIHSEKDSSPRGGMFIGLNLYLLYALVEALVKKMTANQAVEGTAPRGRLAVPSPLTFDE